MDVAVGDSPTNQGAQQMGETSFFDDQNIMIGEEKEGLLLETGAISNTDQTGATKKRGEKTKEKKSKKSSSHKKKKHKRSKSKHSQTLARDDDVILNDDSNVMYDTSNTSALAASDSMFFGGNDSSRIDFLTPLPSRDSDAVLLTSMEQQQLQLFQPQSISRPTPSPRPPWHPASPMMQGVSSKASKKSKKHRRHRNTRPQHVSNTDKSLQYQHAGTALGVPKMISALPHPVIEEHEMLRQQIPTMIATASFMNADAKKRAMLNNSASPPERPTGFIFSEMYQVNHDLDLGQHPHPTPITLPINKK
jgi:hypothetical protein